MLFKTGNDQIRFKPRPVTGVTLATAAEPDWLLLDGQQRLTSLAQALSGDGVVDTEDSRGKKMTRRYYVHIKTALAGDDRIDEAVRSVPGDGVVRTTMERMLNWTCRTRTRSGRRDTCPCGSCSAAPRRSTGSSRCKTAPVPSFTRA